jgi:hypothetical protein
MSPHGKTPRTLLSYTTLFKFLDFNSYIANNDGHTLQGKNSAFIIFKEHEC